VGLFWSCACDSPLSGGERHHARVQALAIAVENADLPLTRDRTRRIWL
jgi:hypothetical protein